MGQTNVTIDNVVGHEIKVEDIKKVVETIKKVVKIGKGIAAITPTDLDDKTLAAAEQVIALVQPLVEEEWFADLVDFVVHLFVKHQNPADFVKALKAIALAA